MNPVPLFLIIVTLPLLLGSECNAELRTWTAVNGNEIEAEFVSNEKGIVKLKLKSGKVFEVPANKLSKEDNEFIIKIPSADSEEVKPVEIDAIASIAKEWKERVESRRNDGDRYYYEKGTDTFYSGKYYEVESKPEVYIEGNIKDGLFDGIFKVYRPNGMKMGEIHFNAGEVIENSEKWWNDKGEPVESKRQAMGKEERKQESQQIIKTLRMAADVGKALHSYAFDFDERFPEKLEDLVPNYLDDKSSFSMTCEDGSRKPFHYVEGLMTKGEADKVILYSPEPIESKRIVGFVDGSVSTMEEGEFRTLVKDSKRKLKHSEVDALLRKRNGSKKDNLEIVKQYLSNGGSINQRNQFGGTLLHVASVNGNKEIVKLLLSKGAKVNVKNNTSLTPLGLALKFKRSEVSELLREYGAKTGEEIKPTQISNELLSAVKKGNEKAVKKQLDDGVDVTVMDEKGATVLHYAAIGGRDVIIKILLKAGADVNAKMKNNNTPLHMAIFGGAKKDALLALLEGGANVNAQTSLKWTPLDAVEYGRSRSSSWRDETIELLRASGGKTKEELRGKQNNP